jgi:chromosome segregation ATPase
MELEQILKQIEWLDDERRKDKDVIAKQEDRIASLEGNLRSVHQQIKDMGSEITRLSAIIARMDQFDQSITDFRIETNRQFEEIDKIDKKRHEEVEKVRRVEMRAVDSNLAELRKEIEAIAGLRRAVHARVDEEARLSKSIDELKVKIQELKRNEEEHSRTYRMVEDTRRQDSKRLVDLQGEVSVMRKRTDELRGQIEITVANFRKAESRLKELHETENERANAQAEFLEKQALNNVERDRIWKEWEARFEGVERQAEDVENHLQTLDATHRVVKRSKEALDELAERIGRRIGEFTEVQRLSEERFRQDWTTFKADDQKRWTNYTLTQEEQRGEIHRQFDKLSERIIHLEDGSQEIHDLLEEISDQTEKRLQSLLALAHEWVSAYERAFGHVR